MSPAVREGCCPIFSGLSFSTTVVEAEEDLPCPADGERLGNSKGMGGIGGTGKGGRPEGRWVWKDGGSFQSVRRKRVIPGEEAMATCTGVGKEASRAPADRPRGRGLWMRWQAVCSHEVTIGVRCISCLTSQPGAGESFDDTFTTVLYPGGFVSWSVSMSWSVWTDEFKGNAPQAS